MDACEELSTSMDMCEYAGSSVASTASAYSRSLTRVRSFDAVKIPASFQQRYLDTGLWPDPQTLRRQLQHLQDENRELSRRLQLPCEQCAREKLSHAQTRAALSEALTLSHKLLEEVRRLSTT